MSERLIRVGAVVVLVLGWLTGAPPSVSVEPLHYLPPDKIPSWCPTAFCAGFRAQLRLCAQPADPRSVPACIAVLRAADTSRPWCKSERNCFELAAFLTKTWAQRNLASGLCRSGTYDQALAMLHDVDFAYDTRRAKADTRAMLAAARGDGRSKPAVPDLAPPPPAAARPSEPDTPIMSTGSGIAISPVQGRILTNHHVIEGCHDIFVRRAPGQLVHAALLYADIRNDLALLGSDIVFSDAEAATLKVSPPVRNGEEIAVFGYPLPQLLSTSGNITRGNVSSLAGVGDDERMLQVTAPIQPGNSGGPLLDQSGNVVGIVEARLSDRSMTAIGQVPQNVNFAIKAGVAARFLDENGVRYRTASAGAVLDLPSIADVARRFTVLIVCQ